jgi:uncharacterized protein YbaP (TraB family)
MAEVRCRTILVLALVSTFGTACRSSDSSIQRTAPPDKSADVVPAPAATTPASVKPLFWSAEKDGNTTYLLGTIHVGVDAEARLPSLVWEKLVGAKSFAMETDLSDPAVLKLPFRSGGTLHEDLGDDYWHKLEAAVTPGMAHQIDRMKPLVAVSQLSLRGLPSTPPMDGVLLARAQKDGKQIVYLEPASREAAILEKWMNARALKEMLDDLAETDQLTKDMLAAYAAGDEAKMLALTDRERAAFMRHGHSDAEYAQEMDELIHDRNASWIEPIEKLHGAGGGFVAVGAMHLIGDKSVLQMLEKRGFKITRL